jgi:hypothetical protein
MASTPAIGARMRDNRFFSFISVLLAALVFAGFARSFFLNSYFLKLHLRPLFIAHGIVFSTWIGLIIVQTFLISAKQVRIHRKLGYASIAIVAAMIGFGFVMAVDAARRGFTPTPEVPPLRFFAISFFDLINFTILITAAFLYRNRAEFHKRLILVSTIVILTPATARIVFLFSDNGVLFKAYGIDLAVLLICVAYDLYTRRKVHPAYLYAGGLFLVSIPARLIISGTDAWLAFAHRITGA